jgi:hypothetical protein
LLLLSQESSSRPAALVIAFAAERSPGASGAGHPDVADSIVRSTAPGAGKRSSAMCAFPRRAGGPSSGSYLPREESLEPRGGARAPPESVSREFLNLRFVVARDGKN